MCVALTRVSLKMASFSCNSMVRGYHVYKDVCAATDGEILCNVEERQAIGSIHLQYVAVIKDGAVVGHVPK